MTVENMEWLYQQVCNRIRTTPACNFPLTYFPLNDAMEQFRYGVANTGGQRQQALIADAANLLRATLDAPEADLVEMVKRGRAFVGVLTYEEQRQKAAVQRLVLPAGPRVSPAEMIARLATRGITLAATRKGELHATPAGLLDEADRNMIRGHKGDLLAALAASVETF